MINRKALKVQKKLSLEEESCSSYWTFFMLISKTEIQSIIVITQVNIQNCTEIKPVVSVWFWVAESESGIRFSPSRRNFAVLPISWLPGLKISFSRFSEKLWEISKIWPNIGDSKLNSAHFKKKKLKIGSAVLEILAI